MTIRRGLSELLWPTRARPSFRTRHSKGKSIPLRPFVKPPLPVSIPFVLDKAKPVLEEPEEAEPGEPSLNEEAEILLELWLFEELLKAEMEELDWLLDPEVSVEGEELTDAPPLKLM